MLVRLARVAARRALHDARERRERVADWMVGARQRPVVTYAALLDGRTLALCVRHPGPRITVAACAIEGSPAHSTPVGLGDLTASNAPPGCLAGSVSLDALTSSLAGPGRVEVVAIHGHGLPTALVWLGEAPHTPIHGPWPGEYDIRMSLSRRRPLMLQLRPAAPAALVTEVHSDVDAAVISLSHTGIARAVRLREGKGLVGEMGLASSTGVTRCEVRDSDVPIREGETAVVSLVTDEGELPIRRRHPELADPGYAVPMPAVSGRDPGHVRPALRLVYLPDGQLGVRRLMQPRDPGR